MTADTITIQSLDLLAGYLEIAAAQARKIRDESERGDIDPKDAAADIRLVMAKINALAS
jgi:hypothetical protein